MPLFLALPCTDNGHYWCSANHLLSPPPAFGPTYLSYNYNSQITPPHVVYTGVRGLTTQMRQGQPPGELKKRLQPTPRIDIIFHLTPHPHFLGKKMYRPHCPPPPVPIVISDQPFFGVTLFLALLCIETPGVVTAIFWVFHLPMVLPNTDTTTHKLPAPPFTSHQWPTFLV